MIKLFLILFFIFDITLAEAKSRCEVSLLEDTQKLSINMISKNQEFKQVEKDKNLDFGYSSNDFWFKISCLNDEGFKDKVYFLIYYQILSRIDVFFDGESTPRYELGNGQDLRKRPIKYKRPIVPINISDHSITTVYIHVSSAGSIQLKFDIIDDIDKFIEDTSLENIGLGVYFGVLIVMSVYNLMLFFSIRHLSSLYYSICVITHGLYQLAINGLGYVYIWGDHLPWSKISALTLTPIFIFSVLIFSREILNIKKFSKSADRFFVWLILINVVLIPFSFISKLYRPLSLISSVIAIISGLFCVSCGYTVWQKRSSLAAKYFFFGWAAIMSGIILIILRNFGIVPSNFITNQSLLLGSSLEVLLFSFGLNAKISGIQNEKSEKEKELVLEKKEKEISQNIAKTMQMIAHDVRRPFSKITSFIQIMKANYSTESNQDLIETVEQEVTRDMALVELMLNDIAEFGSNFREKRNESLASILHTSILESVHYVKKKNILFKINIDDNVTVKVDSIGIMRVISNILTNALEAMDEGNEIIVKSSSVTDKIALSITNTGSSIPNEDLARVFDFDYTRGKANGHGFGLAIARMIVIDHGGSISCQSTNSTVTFEINLPKDHLEVKSFALTWPKSSDDILGQMDQNATGDPLMKHTEALNQSQAISCIEAVESFNIAIIEDEEFYRRYFQSLTSQNSFAGKIKVYESIDGSNIEEIIDSNEIHLLITDIDLKQQYNGFDVIERIRKRYPNLFICIHSQRTTKSDITKASQVGADEYIPKPITKSHLNRLIYAALNTP